MTYVFKNLKSLFSSNKFIAFLLLLIEISSVLVILFSFGTYGSYSSMKENALDDEGISISFYSGNQPTDGSEEPNGTVTVDEIRMLLDSLSTESKEALSGFYFTINCRTNFNFGSPEYFYKDQNGNEYTEDYCMVSVRLEYKPESDSYGMCESAVKNTAIAYGRYFSDNEEYMNSNYIVFPEGSSDEFIGKTVEFLGKEYEVIGIHGYALPEINLPFNTLDGGQTVSSIWLLSDNNITKPAYEELKRLVHEISGGREVMTDSAVIDFSQIKYYNTILLVTITIAVIAAINLAILYAYILAARQTTTGIMMLCGCSKLKARLICNAEILLVSTVLYCICATVYHFVLLSPIIKYFGYLKELYGIKNYLMIYGFYIAAILLFVNIAFSLGMSKSLVRMLSERRK